MRKGIMVILMIILAALSIAGCGKETPIEEYSTVLSDDENIDGSIIDGTIAGETVIEGAVKNMESIEKGNGKEYTYIELSKEMYATTSVNVRSGADVNFEKTGVLSQNQEVLVIGQCNETGWYKIQYNDGYGFVSNDYLSEEKIIIQEEAEEETQTEVQSVLQGDWVAGLQVAQNTSQIMVVAASGNTATLSMHNKNADGSWTEILSTSAGIGRNGIGKSAEGDGKTPQGVYGFSFAFGIQPNPGTALSYTQVDDSYYWVDDSNSAYYNQFVSTNNVACDWNSAEHITGAGSSYNYVLAINYNSGCVPGAGSAIFLHCKPTGGAGCIAVSENSMVTILQNVQPGCVLIIDSTGGIYNY